jgi:hypothetical protein
MKHKLFISLLFVMSFCAFQAQANIITDVEVVDRHVSLWKNDSIFNPVTWTHDLSDTDFVLGTARSANLIIEFSDDASDLTFVSRELATIIVGVLDLQDDDLFYTPVTDWSRSLGVNSLVEMNAFGMLDVTIWSDFGDFYVGNSILEVTTAVIPKASTDISEPAAILILGMGLAGLGMVRQRKLSN